MKLFFGANSLPILVLALLCRYGQCLMSCDAEKNEIVESECVFHVCIVGKKRSVNGILHIHPPVGQAKKLFTGKNIKLAK